MIGYEKRWTTFEIMSATALACHEIVKNKGSKKFSKNLWDIGNKNNLMPLLVFTVFL